MKPFAVLLICVTAAAAQDTPLKPVRSMAGAVRHDAIGVSIIRLVASPKEYDGKAVRVLGYLNIAFEHNAIYLHREDLEHGLSINGLWIAATREMMLELRKLSGQYVLIEGVFDSQNTGHGNLFSGAIVEINRAQAWRSR
jgi:hypothetical protein